jgi:hypothetical protein
MGKMYRPDSVQKNCFPTLSEHLWYIHETRCYFIQKGGEMLTKVPKNGGVHVWWSYLVLFLILSACGGLSAQPQTATEPAAAPTDSALPTPLANLVAQTTVQLQPGDGVILYTSGILKAQNPAGEAYGLDRLGQVVSRQWTQPAERIKQAVIEDVHRHIGLRKVQDDLTLLVIKQR